ncbi:MAG: hypothetical protein OXM61_17445 [Candidatus Poribacteria bacterium]|nr:hypothetical protein [Candidatus Poribacteria bacterium]
MCIESDRKRLTQEKTLEWAQRELDPAEWLTVLNTPSDVSQDCAIYSILVSLDKVSYPHSYFDDYCPSGSLVAWFSTEEYQETFGIDKDRNGNSYLIIDQDPGTTEGKELYQKFRYSLNLEYDAEKGEYFFHDRTNDNEKVVVVVVNGNWVKIRFKQLQRFLKSEEIYLAVRFNCSEHSRFSMEDLGVNQHHVDSENKELTDGHLYWRYTYRESYKDEYQTESILDVIRLIGYAKIPKNRTGFIVGYDEYGSEIRYELYDIRGAIYQNIGWSSNPTFVCFKKEVLDKYYIQDSKYSVGDLLLTWQDEGTVQHLLPIDDDHDTVVWVMFSRLSLLPYEEQVHWQAHNIAPKGKPSETYLNRYIPGRTSTESNRLEHRFRNRYSKLSQLCNKILGWHLLSPLGDNDAYRLRCLRIPSSDEQKDFDELILSLATILIDSLNQGCILELISKVEKDKLKQKKENLGSLDYFESFLYSYDVKNIDKYISFLRKLQQLRSSGSAHRKGKKYEKLIRKNFHIENQAYRQGFERILRQAVEFLEFLNHIIETGELIGKRELSFLYDLKQNFYALLIELSPSDTDTIIANETWINEIGHENRYIVDHLMRNVIGKYESSPLELMSFCKQLLINQNPGAKSSDIKNALTELAKKFIWQAERSLRNAMSLIFMSQAIKESVDNCFEDTFERVIYSKILFECSVAFVNLDEIKDYDWYRNYAAWHLSYANLYTSYAYEHVLHADGLDSAPVVLDTLSVVEGVANVVENVLDIVAVREKAEQLVQVVKVR